MDDTRLAVSITDHSGNVKRWAHDEPAAADILQGLQFSRSIPGGDRELSGQLARRIGQEYPDLNLLDEVRLYGPGGETVWTGRMHRFPRTHGNDYGITPQAVGQAVRLRDDPTFREIYVDRDLGNWGDAPIERHALHFSSGISTGDLQHTTSPGAVLCAFPNQALAAETLSEVWYRAPAGVTIAAMQFIGTLTSLPAGWTQGLYVSDDLDGSPTDAAGGSFTGSISTTSIATARRYLFHQVYSDGTAATPAAGGNVRMTKVAVRGNHGLTFRTTSSGEPDGLYASDIVDDIVSRCAPELARDITATSYAIPHVVFPDPVTAEEAIGTANAYDLYKWWVHDGTFHYAPWDSSSDIVWEARLSRGAHVTFEGDDADGVFNGVVVSFTDPDGISRIAAPTGFTGADATSDTLADTSEANPVNAHGVTRKWAKLDLSFTTTPEAAVVLGATWLTEHSLPGRRGSITLHGHVTHPTIGDRPVWAVHAGDWIRIADHPADVPRRITEVRYTHDQRQLVCSVDNTPYLLDAILERAGVHLVGVI